MNKKQLDKIKKCYEKHKKNIAIGLGAVAIGTTGYLIGKRGR